MGKLLHVSVRKGKEGKEERQKRGRVLRRGRGETRKELRKKRARALRPLTESPSIDETRQSVRAKDCGLIRMQTSETHF